MDQVVSWVGEIDYAQRDVLIERTSEALSVEGLTRLVIDLSGVSFIDSTGLGILLDARKHSLDRDVGFVLRDIPKSVARLFELTGLSGLFDNA